MSRQAAFGLLCLLAFAAGAVVVLVGLRDGAAMRSAAPSSLAARINGACRPGYVASDWRVREGIVEVTCDSRKVDMFGTPADSYRIAVDR